MAIVALILHHNGGATIKFTTALQSPMMLAFFTTVGIGGSLALIAKGGKALVVYLVFCWLLAVIQNGVGAGLAKVFGIHPVFGVMAGAVSLEGGHGAAAAFGSSTEALGIVGAKAVAIASATFGLIMGGLLGGPVCRMLIEKNHVDISASDEAIYQKSASEVMGEGGTDAVDSAGFMKMLCLVLSFMAIGAVVSKHVNAMFPKSWNFSLPGYVMAMFVAVMMVTNLPMFSLKLKSFKYKEHTLVFNFLIFAAFMLILFKWLAVPILIFAYILVSFVKWLANRNKEAK
jgi:ESS family glutamate:Na+ symporter